MAETELTKLTSLVLGMMDKAKLILESGQELMPVFLFQAEEGPSKILGLPWRDADEKEIMLEVVRCELENPNIIAYVSVTEAWMSQDLSSRPSQAADRKVIVVVNGVARDGEQVAYFAPVIEEGSRRRLGNPELQDNATMGGPIANLFE